MNETVTSNIISSTLHTMVYHMRYSGAHVIRKENVAEHSYFVTMIADLIAQDIRIKHNEVKIDQLKLLHMALYHDTEEAYTGDLITPVKNKSQTLRDEWDKLCSIMMQEGLQHDFPGQEHIKNHILSIHTMYETGKNEVLENQIVKFADGFQSLVYLLREIGFGNQYVVPIIQNIIQSLQKRFQNHLYLSSYVSDLQAVVSNSLSGKCNLSHIKPNAIQK